MELVTISPSIQYIGVDDKTIDLFESQYIVPHGISYNSYVILDEKIAVMDTVDARATGPWLKNLADVLGDRKPDYLVVSHMEPDHASNIQTLAEKYPDMKIVASAKALSMIPQFFTFDISDRSIVAKEGETLSLGQHTLQFFMAPMVHWPEVMVTYDVTDKIVFSADAFGTYGTLDGGVIDTEMNVEHYWEEMIRYYSNIVGKYGSPVQRALQKLSGLDIQTICSTHGPVWREYASKAIDIYDRMSRYEGEEGVVIIYGSMYGNTEQMAEAIAASLADNGIKNIVMHNVSKSPSSYILKDVFKYKGVIVGSPTYSNQLFPEVEAVLSKIELREVKNRIFGYFGSFTWAGAAVKRLAAFGEKMKWETVGTPVEQKQGLSATKYEECLALGKEMAGKLKTINDKSNL